MTTFNFTQKDAQKAVDALLKAGATDGYCQIVESVDTSAAVSGGHYDGIELNRSRDIYLTAYVGQKSASVNGNDLSSKGIATLVKQVVSSAKDASDNPYEGLPAPSDYAQDVASMDLVDKNPPSYAQLKTLAEEMSAAAYKNKAVVAVTSTAQYQLSQVCIATSNGFAGSYQKSYSSMVTSATAEKGSYKAKDYGYKTVVHAKDLPKAASIGRKAAKLAAGQLNIGKLEKSGTMPVVFDKRIGGRTLKGNLLSLLGASAIADGNSYFNPEDIGGQVVGDNITLYDNRARKDGIGARPFNGVGVAGPKKVTYIQQGRLKDVYLSVQGQRKLAEVGVNLPLNGRSPAATAFKGGEVSDNALLADIKLGFYVTSVMGQGFKANSADISYSASGYIIRDGKVTNEYVLEASIAGNLIDILNKATLAKNVDTQFGVPLIRIDDSIYVTAK